MYIFVVIVGVKRKRVFRRGFKERRRSRRRMPQGSFLLNREHVQKSYKIGRKSDFIPSFRYSTDVEL